MRLLPRFTLLYMRKYSINLPVLISIVLFSIWYITTIPQECVIYELCNPGVFMMDDAPVGGGDVGGASNPSGADLGTGGASNPSAAGGANTTGLGGTLKAGNKYGEIVVCDPKNQDFVYKEWETNQPLADHLARLLDRQSRYVYSNNANSPLDQFEIRNLISLDVPILGYLRIFVTNIAFYLVTATVIAFTFNLLGTNKDKIVANYWSISQESIYATINSIVINQINSKKGQIYFPFIYTLFLFILINNLVGMVPYSFASTSHFILTFFISFTVVLGATILGFQKHGLKLFSLFVPAGCPLGLLPLLVIIEFISYLARNVSLGLRLAANILSGHMLLNILSGFAYNIMTSGFVYFFVGLIPLAFIIAFSGLELGIAFIQAQVFVVLTSSYIKDALDLH